MKYIFIVLNTFIYTFCLEILIITTLLLAIANEKSLIFPFAVIKFSNELLCKTL